MRENCFCAENLNLGEGNTVMHFYRCFYSKNPLVDVLESEDEETCFCAENLNLGEGKTVKHSCMCFYSDNPLVDMLESEDEGNLLLHRKPQFE